MKWKQSLVRDELLWDNSCAATAGKEKRHVHLSKQGILGCFGN